MHTATPRPTPLQIWLMAARPRTLPAAAAPVIVGSAAAWYGGVFQLWPALAALFGALLIQIGANLANDVFDFQKGADTKDRLGPVRVTAEGLLTPGQVFTGVWATFGLAVLVGLYLVWVGGWPIVLIGVASILAGLAYTGGPFPLGYHGLGDIFVFIFFGLVAVCGTYYVQAANCCAVSGATVRLSEALCASPAALAWWAAAPIGLLATAIIVVNNLRDIDTDRAAGKRTLAVRLGQRGAQIEYALLIGLAYLAPVGMWLSGVAPPGVLLTWASLPRAVLLARSVFTVTGKPLNAALAGTGQLELLYGLLFAVGLLATRWVG
ncbi:MAG: 1,4-dihydroxy-2-naphthoate polyprenyltransferase [Anaerolineales bacterium]